MPSSTAGADDAPDLPYRPPKPTSTDHGVALIGCGDITEQHLTAYREMGLEVVAFCDIEAERARQRRDEFYPDGDVYTDAAAVYDRSDVDVVDVATHPEPRVALIEDAIDAGLPVLSQKPFVTDLAVGRRLVERAEEAGVRLAVNQNGRWAPHLSYLREAVASDLIGEVVSVHVRRHWDHDWIADTPFGSIDHAILYDYAIHWFDFLATVTPRRSPCRVHASTARSPVQTAAPPLLAQATVEYDTAQASLVFDGNVRVGGQGRTYIAGSDGAVAAEGPSIEEQTVTVHGEAGAASPSLEGSWFPTGMQGTMGELLSAIEDDREPAHSGRNNLATLELCFAAIESAETGEPAVPGEVRALPDR